MTDPPAPGTLRLYDAVRPALTDGPHRIRVVTTVEQSTDSVTWNPLDTGLPPSDSFVAVTGAEYRLAADAVLVSHPAANSTGDYGDTLPHVVLRDRTLPWQRTVEGTETGTPWLALLVFDTGESTLTRGASAADGQVYDTVTATDAGWRAALPRRADMSLLCHVRQVNVDDRELGAGDDDGWVAVVTANRVPATGQTHRACLVSLAGHQNLLDATEAGAPTLPAATLPLLHDWGFSVSEGGTFHDVLARVATRSAALGISPAHPLLLPRTDREGVGGQARYHGPLAGGGTDPAGDAPDLSADTAVQLGRLLAAADRSLIRELSEWHRLDLLDAEGTARMSAAAATAPDTAGAAARQLAAAQMTTPEVAVQRLIAFRTDPWGVPSVAGGRGAARPAPRDATVPAAERADPVAAGAVERPAPVPSRAAALSARVSAVTGSGQASTAPPPGVAAALANFALLRGLPLTYLVPQLALLPDESIRFFTVDHGWLDALATGLLSVGGTGTRATAFAARNAGPARAQVRADLRRTAATLNAARARIADAAVAAARSRSEEDMTSAAATDVVTGLLLRSSAVSRWPQLEVRAFAEPPAPEADPAGLSPLAPLRLERLTPSLLLVLFAGTPAAVWIEEPHHGLQLGFDRDPANGALTLPSRLTGDTAVTVPVRGSQARLIDVPGLATALATALAGQLGEPATVGPGALAAELIRPPFRQVFQ
ncbi:MAG: hypothetical protein ACOYBY_14060 [Dermatophilaceae bacterium]